MKKVISAIVLVGLLVGLVAPLAVSAQSERIKDFCTIKNDMTWKSGRICKGTDGVADPNCDTATAADCETGPGDNCKLVSGDTIGGGAGVITVYKADGTPVEPKVYVKYYAEQWGMVCLINTITNLTNWIFYLLMVIVVVLIVIGGATYMLAAGDPEKAGRGKSIIIYGIIGLAIALLARLIPSVVRLIVGMG